MIEHSQIEIHPVKAILRNFAYGITLAIPITFYRLMNHGSQWYEFPGFVLAGCGVVFVGWGVERLWLSAVAQVIARPFSFFGFATRLPFWYIGGGVGYCVGMLFGKKLGVLWFYDIPVKSIFTEGARMGCLFQSALHLFSSAWMQKQIQFFRSDVLNSNLQKNKKAR